MTTKRAKGADCELVTPVFVPQLEYPNPSVSDYRCAVDPTGSRLLFERTTQGATTLWWVDLAGDGVATPFLSAGPRTQTRPDWLRSTSFETPVAYSSGEGICLATADGSRTMLIPGTGPMIYPSWYPDPRRLAVMHTIDSSPRTSVIDREGSIVFPSLAGADFYAGMPSVNHAFPERVAFAGQKVQPTDYDQTKNYVLVCTGEGKSAQVSPLESGVNINGPFQPEWQGRAPWWSPDGTWVAFESTRVAGAFAVFLKRYDRSSPAIQVTDTRWQAQHPKWIDSTTLVAPMLQDPSSGGKLGLATLDVSSIVGAA